MKTRIAGAIASSLVLAGCGVGASSSLATGAPRSEQALEVFEGPVPVANCGEGSRPETDLQGRVPAEDVASGRAAQGYTCNIEILGHEGNAANLTLAAYDHCFYYGIGDFQGVAVVDASDAAAPLRTQTLMSPAMSNPLESLRVSDARGLLAAVQGPSSPGFFDVYDVSGDCGAPVLKSIVPATVVGHEGIWSPDGLTYWATTTYGVDAISAIDVTDPSSPHLITHNGTQNSHGLSISDDGNRAYLTDQKLSNQTGMTIVDASAVQRHEAGAAMPKISSITWDDGATGQHTIPVRVGGKPYVIYVDEGGYGAARFIDISDETAPRVVSKLKLEIHMPENRTAAVADGAGGFLHYDGHFCSVPRRDDPQVLVCGYSWSGLRVFDIRDVYKPKEIAYWNPAASPGQGVTGNLSPPHFDLATGRVAFTIKGNNGPGFYIGQLTADAWPLK